MLGDTCFRDADCQFMNQCSNGLCQHKDILPLSPYTIFIYIAIGLACSLCNAAGSSMGIFKIIFLVIGLNYELGEATGLAQAMVVGAALPNFVTVIMRKHPNGSTSLVNYRILQIMIPCCLLGSVLGAITQTIIPKLGQLFLGVVLFSFFVFTFTDKIRKLFRGPHIKKSVLQKSLEKANQRQISEQEKNEALIQKIQDENEDEEYDDDDEEEGEGEGANNEPELPLSNQQIKELSSQQMSKQQAELRNYEASHHAKQVLFCVALFLVFQFLSFLAQGKLPFYSISKCSFLYPIGILGLIAVTCSYVYWLRRNFIKIFGLYKKYNIPQQVHLDERKSFYKVVVGSLLSGFVQGTLGMGGGTFTMMVLLSFHLESTAASATSGYQILFTGLASLSEYYINGEVKMFQSFWFLGVCCAIGGVATLVLYYVISRMNKLSVDKVMMGIILFLCLMNIFLTIPTALRIYDDSGWQGLTSIQFTCD